MSSRSNTASRAIKPNANNEATKAAATNRNFIVRTESSFLDRCWFSVFIWKFLHLYPERMHLPVEGIAYLESLQLADLFYNGKSQSKSIRTISFLEPVKDALLIQRVGI